MPRQPIQTVIGNLYAIREYLAEAEQAPRGRVSGDAKEGR